MFPQIVDEAEKRINALRTLGNRPFAKLFDLLGSWPATLTVTDTTPELDGFLVVLALTSLKFETRLPCLSAQDAQVLNVLLEQPTADLQVVHTWTAKLTTPFVPQVSKLLSDISLHFGRSRGRPERHSRPLIQSRATANHQQLLCRVIELKLSVSPNGIHYGVVLFEGG